MLLWAPVGPALAARTGETEGVGLRGRGENRARSLGPNVRKSAHCLRGCLARSEVGKELKSQATKFKDQHADILLLKFKHAGGGQGYSKPQDKHALSPCKS